MIFYVEYKKPKRRSERIAKRPGYKAPPRRHAPVLFFKHSLDAEAPYRQFLPPLLSKEKVPEADSEMRPVYSFVWIDERGADEPVPPMKFCHQLRGDSPRDERRNQEFQGRCQRRHEILAVLGRGHADTVIRELQREFPWTPMMEYWERVHWGLPYDELKRRGPHGGLQYPVEFKRGEHRVNIGEFPP